MSESTSSRAPNGNGQVPAWMQTVDEETFYNVESNDDASAAPSASSPTEAPTDPTPNNSSPVPAGHPGDSSFDEKLALSMGGPTDIPEPDPDLQPTPVGHVRADLDEQLEKAVSVLATRYASEFSRSLILEYALRRILLSLRQEGENSALVQWLDSVLPRSQGEVL